MLNEEQAVAVVQMHEHCEARGGNPFMRLIGPAGTGKTFCMSHLAQRTRKRMVFTAPTNKAVKVLQEAMRKPGYKPDTCTIYSLLGLVMKPDGEVKVLAVPDDEVDLSQVDVVVIDEASMINTPLWGHIKAASRNHSNIRWVLMGDDYQLPPVGEAISPIFEVEMLEVRLTKIMRQDNQILKLSADLRGRVEKPYGALTLSPDNDGLEGIWTLSYGDFEARVKQDADRFIKGEAKAVAWRNLRVNHFNRLIRAQHFAEFEKYPWQKGDRITMLGPINDRLRQTEDGKYPLVATTDEEGTVEDAQIAPHPQFKDFECWRILCRTDFNAAIVLWALHPSAQAKFETRTARLAAEAKANGKLWAHFWDFKDAFHPVRHAYAITAHRAQGSTYHAAYVNWRDILLNDNRAEAYRCLYVAASRPKKELYLG